MKQTSPDYRQAIRQEFGLRFQKNPRYSLRAFAKSLDINPGALSNILNRKSALSYKAATKLSSRLFHSPEHSQSFLSSVVTEQKNRKLKRRDPKVQNFNAGESTQYLSNEEYSFISEWYYGAILELTYLNDFRDSPHWISKTLGITPAQAALALSKLKEMGLLALDSGRLKKSKKHLTTLNKSLTTPALQKKQIEIREKAIESIQNDPAQIRRMTTQTMAIDPALLPEAYRRIDQFNQSLCEFLESGKRKQVYVMEVGLFPLQKTPTKQE